MSLAEAKSKWAFIKNAYFGDGGFSNGGYLDQFSREVDSKYNSRKNIAYYTNYLKPAVDRFKGYIFKKTAMRSSGNELIKIIFDDCDKNGNSIDIFISKVFENAFLYGLALVMVDMPKELGASLKEQKESRALPYFKNISPLNLYDYELDNGVFKWVILENLKEIKEPFKASKSIKEYHYIDSSKFEKRDESFKIIESYEHNLGITPVFALSFGSDLLAGSICYDIARISRRIYNARSELDEILRGQTFSILTYNATQNARPDQLKVSTDNCLLYYDKPPAFISPSGDSATIYMSQIEKLEGIIEQISLDPASFSTRANDSGAALKFKFENLNSQLNTFARGLENFERVLFECVFRWLGVEYDFSCAYAKDYQIDDLSSQIEIAAALKELGMPISWENAKKKELVNLDLLNIDDEQKNEIYSEIDTLKNI